MSEDTNGIINTIVVGTPDDAAAAAAAIQARGGRVVSVRATPSADGTTLEVQIEYVGGE